MYDPSVDKSIVDENWQQSEDIEDDQRSIVSESSVRFSARIRNRSVKTNRDPNFVYEEPTPGVGEQGIEQGYIKKHKGKKINEDPRRRSASWCGSNRVAVVERKIPGTKINKSRKKRDKELKIPRLADVSDGTGVNAFQEQQRELSQQRIDILFKQKTPGVHKECSISDKGDYVTTGGNYLGQYGSDFDTETSNTGTALNETLEACSSQNLEGEQNFNMVGVDWSKLMTEMKKEINSSVNTAVEAAISSIKLDVPTLKEDVNVKNTTISSLETTNKSTANELTKMKTQLKVCQIQLNKVTGITIRQNQEICECKSKIEQLERQLNRNIVKLRGVKEVHGENCMEVVQKFFEEVLEIEKAIPLIDAYRVGKGDNRMLILHLLNSRDKSLIYANVNKLKEINSSRDIRYSIDEQLTAQQMAEKQRKRQIWAANKGMSTGDQLRMSFERNKLIVEGKEYKPEVAPPTCKEILQANTEEQLNRAAVSLVRSVNVESEQQLFIGYTLPVKTIQDVNLALAKVKTMHTDARHVICAFRLPHRNYHTHQDYFEDGEISGGEFLLQLMESSEIYNRAVFIVRYYNGTHIGGAQFKALKSAMCSALDRSDQNPITGMYDCVWEDGVDVTKAENRWHVFNFGRGQSKPIHSRGGQRGGWRGRGNRGGNYSRGRKESVDLDGQSESGSYAEAVKSPTANNQGSQLGQTVEQAS